MVLLDVTFDPGDGVSKTGETPQVFAIATQSGGKVLLSGQFDHYGTYEYANLARLNNNGAIDATFNPPASMVASLGTPSVNALAVQPADNKILIGGNFNLLDAGVHNYIARLGADGAVDPTFTASADGTVYALLVQPDGKILLGGTFSHVNGTAYSGIARLLDTGALDPAFTSTGIGPAGQAVTALAVQEGKVYIAGNFATYNGTARSMIARLNSNGSLDTTFNPGDGVAGESAHLQAVVPQPDGRLLIGGKFDSYNHTNLSNFIRLNNNGTIDATFVARMDPFSSVKAVLLQPDNKILIGGDFTGFFSRLLNLIESCYTLTTAANPAVGGTVTVAPPPNCPGGKYISASSLQLTAAPGSVGEYYFIDWSGNASGSANPLTVFMNANKSITANFLEPPTFFNKLSPLDETTTRRPSSLTLSWSASSTADSYEYCLYTAHSSDCDVEFGNWVSTGSSTTASISNLLPSVTYHWQVRARNRADTTDANGGWWHFARNGTPSVPVTVSPADQIEATRPNFVWNESAGAASYHLIVERVSPPGNVIDETVDDSFCTAAVCTYPAPVTLPLGSYRFKVSAIEADTSDYSPWRSFSVVIRLLLSIYETLIRSWTYANFHLFLLLAIDPALSSPRAAYLKSRPPLTSTVAPVMKLLAGLARKTITRAISSGVAKRCSSILLFA